MSGATRGARAKRRCRWPGLGGLLLALAGGAAAQGMGTDAAASPPAAPASAAPAGTGLLIDARRSVRSATVWLASGVDSWFGDKPFSDGGKVRDGLLSVRLLTRQGEAPEFNLRFGARMRLPNLEERAYLFFGRDDPRDVVRDKPEAVSRQQLLLRQGEADPVFFAGLGLGLRDEIDFRLGFRGGLKPFAQARYWRTWALGDSGLIDARETLFWTLDDHFGSTTALSFSHAFSPRLVGRWLNAATITEQSRKFEWSSIVGAYRSFEAQRLLSLEMLFGGVQGGEVAVPELGVRAKWEQPLHEDWLLGELSVGHFWPHIEGTARRGREWALGLGLTLRF